jgi:CheY-like chemotaxis protein
LRNLRIQGFAVCTASCGTGALKRVEQDQPDEMTLDITRPDGYELARQVRAQPWGRHTTLRALTRRNQDAQIADEEA